ncbi:peptidase inhibitor family I36 protein [Amycolatopsis sp. VS8301801F10]|uniref:peptidase inhibitor family I36 protein n=1 Tax=Amycolatopsis sp. VS8301801F10 TaxID=2652442 RepID=UPI0038FC3952
MTVTSRILVALAGAALASALAAGSAEAGTAPSPPRPVQSWDGGAVQLFPDTAADWACDKGYLCLYEHAGGRGRHLQFKDRKVVQNLTSYGFNDQMSSWRNRTAHDAFWYYDINGKGTTRRMPAGASQASLGADNDKASSIYIT